MININIKSEDGVQVLVSGCVSGTIADIYATMACVCEEIFRQAGGSLQDFNEGLTEACKDENKYFNGMKIEMGIN